jgi:hypothetical protein
MMPDTTPRELALLADLRRVTAERDELLAGRAPDMAAHINALRGALAHELTAGIEELRRLGEREEQGDRDLVAHLGAALGLEIPAAVLQPIFGGKPFATSLGAELLVAAFKLRSERDELLAAVESYRAGRRA